MRFLSHCSQENAWKCVRELWVVTVTGGWLPLAFIGTGPCSAKCSAMHGTVLHKEELFSPNASSFTIENYLPSPPTLKHQKEDNNLITTKRFLVPINPLHILCIGECQAQLADGLNDRFFLSTKSISILIYFPHILHVLRLECKIIPGGRAGLNFLLSQANLP